MVACARRKLLGRERQAVFHCWTRCVRRVFLCGVDCHTQKDYSHRRDWIVNREEQLAGLFALDIEFRAELSNHLHLVLRTLPRVAHRWSAHEVARRWLTITKLAKCLSDDLPRPDPQRVEALAKDKKKIEQLRRRLGNVSWFMGILCENIARRANVEDDCTGRFWESRFKCRECTDESAVLLCGIYVDLNPFRAGEADAPETARYTSIFQRLQARGMRKNAADRPDAWLGELTYSRNGSPTKCWPALRAPDGVHRTRGFCPSHWQTTCSCSSGRPSNCAAANGAPSRRTWSPCWTTWR